MIELLFVCIAVFFVLCLAEYGGRRKLLKGEVGRKSVHIIVGSFVGFWPLFLSWSQILLLSVAFIVVIGFSRYLRVFSVIHSVQRPTLGEVYFAIVVGLLAVLIKDGWVYLAALLHMSLADGLAAIIGVRYGKRNTYIVFGHKKSVVGTSAFFVVSLLILLTYNYWSGEHISVNLAILTAIGAVTLENASPKGTDNLTVPLWVAFALTSLA
jgi:phytol kinase